MFPYAALALILFPAILPGQEAVPLSVCDVLRNPGEFMGKEIAVRGAAVAIRDVGGVLAGDCQPVLRIDGREWPWAIAVSASAGFARMERPQAPTPGRDQDLIVTMRGVFEMTSGTPRRTLIDSQFPGRLRLTEIVSYELARPSYITVCDALSRRAEIQGTVVSVRGIIRAANRGWYLWSPDCPSEIAVGGISWSRAIWVAGWEPPLEQNRPGRAFGDQVKNLSLGKGEVVVTVTGSFSVKEESALRSDSPRLGFGEGSLFPAQINFHWETQGGILRDR
jgi:hypothetical protein